MLHPLRQLVITVGAPPVINGREGRQVLAAFYGALLGMTVVDEDWLRIAPHRGSPFELALDGDGWSDLRPPAWRDPQRPQQLHLDLASGDQGAAELALDLGATAVETFADHHVLADPAGHPLCIWPDPQGELDAPVSVRRLVFDCFSPRSLASFYEGLLGTERRLEDTAERVVLSLGDPRLPDFGFQHAQFVAARWPEPAYPAQLHVDLRFEDGTAAAVQRAETLGAIRLPKLADTEIYADPAAHPLCL